MDTASASEDTLASRIARNLAVWQLRGAVAATLFIAPFVVTAAAGGLAFFRHRWFEALTREDGLVEWAQVGLLVVAIGAFAFIARESSIARMRAPFVLAVFGAVAATIVAGEEISWGQRLLGWSTPAVLEAINYQGETTIHNIAALATPSRLVQFGAAGYGTILPLVALHRMAPRSFYSSYLLPPVALTSFFVVPFVYWAVRIPLFPTEKIFQMSEVTELLSYGGLAIFAVLGARRFLFDRKGSHAG